MKIGQPAAKPRTGGRSTAIGCNTNREKSPEAEHT